MPRVVIICPTDRNRFRFIKTFADISSGRFEAILFRNVTYDWLAVCLNWWIQWFDWFKVCLNCVLTLCLIVLKLRSLCAKVLLNERFTYPSEQICLVAWSNCLWNVPKLFSIKFEFVCCDGFSAQKVETYKIRKTGLQSRKREGSARSNFPRAVLLLTRPRAVMRDLRFPREKTTKRQHNPEMTSVANNFQHVLCYWRSLKNQFKQKSTTPPYVTFWNGWSFSPSCFSQITCAWFHSQL